MERRSSISVSFSKTNWQWNKDADCSCSLNILSQTASEVVKLGGSSTYIYIVADSGIALEVTS